MFDSVDDLIGFLMKYFDKPERMRALHHLSENLSDEVFWPIFGSVWTNSESLYLDEQHVRELLTEERLASSHRPSCMSQEELQMLRKLDDPIKVFRGCWSGNQNGWSYTTSEKKARWFANRCPMDGQPLIVVGQARKVDVVAYFDGRSEQEIVLPPERLERRRVRKLAPRMPSDSAILGQRIQAYGSESLGDRNIAMMQALTMIQHAGEEAYQKFCDERIAAYSRYGFVDKVEEWEAKKNVMQDETAKAFLRLREETI